MLQPSSMMRDDPNGLARAAAVDFVLRLVPHYLQIFGSELLGAYLMGSMSMRDLVGVIAISTSRSLR